MGEPSATPRRSLSTLDAVAIIVGIVIGAGIFKFPQLVAFNVNSGAAFIGVWIAGGVISLIGALCYAELATTYPNAGGDYHFLNRAFGNGPSFLFAWARLAVIQTGSIAIQAFIIGDYAASILSDAKTSPQQAQIISSVTAAIVVALLTALNVAGVREGKWAQKLLTTCEILGVLLVVGAGFWVVTRGAGPALQPGGGGGSSAIGMAMVFVLLTYGGWNEAAYLSAEVQGDRRNIARALMWGIGVVTGIYLLANLAFLYGLGLDGMRSSSAIAAELLGRATGSGGATLISIIIVIAALSTVNATIFTGARTNYALGRDFPMFRALGQWHGQRNTPANALLVQGLIALALVLFGAMTREGITTMVDYTSPIFWFFFLLVGVAIFVLRRREPNIERPFRVPFYPLTPLLFCLVSAYMLYSSIAYAKIGALTGLAVLAAGVPVMLVARARGNDPSEPRGFDPIVPPTEAMES